MSIKSIVAITLFIANYSTIAFAFIIVFLLWRQQKYSEEEVVDQINNPNTKDMDIAMRSSLKNVEEFNNLPMVKLYNTVKINITFNCSDFLTYTTIRLNRFHEDNLIPKNVTGNCTTTLNDTDQLIVEVHGSFDETTWSQMLVFWLRKHEWKLYGVSETCNGNCRLAYKHNVTYMEIMPVWTERGVSGTYGSPWTLVVNQPSIFIKDQIFFKRHPVLNTFDKVPKPKLTYYN